MLGAVTALLQGDAHGLRLIHVLLHGRMRARAYVPAGSEVCVLILRKLAGAVHPAVRLFLQAAPQPTKGSRSDACQDTW